MRRRVFGTLTCMNRTRRGERRDFVWSEILHLKEGKACIPLKWGSRLSIRWRFLFPSSCDAAARFSIARRSRPRTDTPGVGGSRGIAGLRNVCFWLTLCTIRLEKREDWTHYVFLYETTFPCRFWFENICVLSVINHHLRSR